MKSNQRQRYPGGTSRRAALLVLLALHCFPTSGAEAASPTDLRITEIMAANTRTLTDEDGDFSDWLELHNRGATAVNLDGWFLTDAATLNPRWRFPSTNLASDGYLIVFLSGKNRQIAGAQLHTDFQINANAGYLALVRPDGQSIEHAFSPSYPEQVEDISYGLISLIERTVLVGSGSAAYTLIPDSAAAANYQTNWWGGNEPAFLSAGGSNGWQAGPLAIGFGEPLGGLGRYRRVVTNEASLLSYYTFENVAAGPSGVVDQAPVNPHHGTLSGNATTEANGVGGGGSRALSLPGGVAGYVSLGVVPEFDFTDSSGTIEMWLRPDWLPGSAGTNPSFFANRNASGTRYSMHLRDGQALLDVYTSLANTAFGYSYGVADPQNWHHVAFIIAAGSATLLVDGQTLGSLPIALGSTGRSVQIGHTLAGTEYWRGGIDEVAVYADPLSTAAIQSHYHALAGQPAGARLATDLAQSMAGLNATAWTRVPFTVTNRAAFEMLRLLLQADDGFVAYLNGIKVAEANAPATPDFQSSATAPNDAFAVHQFDLSRELLPGGALREGENVLAIHGLNLEANDADFFISPTLIGEKSHPAASLYFLTPTPGSANENGVIGFVTDTKFSVDRGFYEQPISVAITVATDGAQIWYTRDGSTPSPANLQAFRYTNAIPIAVTTTLRAAAFKTGWSPSGVDTHTYVFVDDVITQPGMDPRIVTNVVYAGSIRSDLKAVPTVSLVLNPADLNSIYSNPNSTGLAWERGTSMEFFDPNTGQEFQIDCGVRIHGADSRNHAKKPFGLFFRASYGAAKLQFPLFEDSPVIEFDKLVLRSGGHDAWTSPHSAPVFSQATGASYIRDEFQRLSQRASGHPSAGGRFVHLYLNGRYWGLYNLIERIDEDFVSGHLGGRDEDWDVLQGPDSGEFIVWGTNIAWNAMLALAEAGLATDNAYQSIQAYLDLDNFIDYMINGIWAGNTDWFMSLLEPQTGGRNKNWFAARNRNGGLFRFFVHDAEISMSKDHQINRRVDLNLTDVNIANSPARLYTRLRQNAEFRLRFADRLQKHLLDSGALAPFNSLERWQQLVRAVRSPLVPESARWGAALGPTVLFSRDNQWLSEIEWMNTVFFVQRNAIVLRQFRSIGLFPSNSAPSLNQFGGVVAPGFALALQPNGVGEIYYTLDGTDPRLPGGAISSSAIPYAGGDIVIASNLTFRVRTLTGDTWSALVEAPFRVVATDNVVTISEIMYHPPDEGAVDGSEFEFVELKNAGATALDLTGLFFSSGITFAFTNGTMLAPGQFFVLARNPSLFAQRYPGVAVNAVFTGRLANEGETITLTDSLGRTALSFAYDTRPPWPIAPDGFGFSLVPEETNAQLKPDQGPHWRASSNPGGSPGANDPPATIPPIVVNEVFSASDPPDVDFIELANPTTNDVDVGGWFLTDDARIPRKFRILDGTTLLAGSLIRFIEASFNPSPETTNSFALNSKGDAVYLFSGDDHTNLTGYSHGFAFAAAERGTSFGRHINSVGAEQFPTQITPTPDASNAGPRVGPVVINEILYHAAPGQDEFVELRNVSGAEVALYDAVHGANTWRFSGAASAFPTNVVLPANGLLLLVGAQPAAFRARYDVPAAVTILQYFGTLQNSGENLELQAPAPPDTNGLSYFVVDAVRYNDKAPWPIAADGSGASLQRRSAAYGNDPAIWVAAGPTPGRPYPGGAPPHIASDPQAMVILKDGDASLTVTVTSGGPLFYQWRFQEDPVPGATNATLFLTNVQWSQAGDYSVVVFNGAGSVASLPARLTVHQPALIVAQPTNQFVRLGSNVTFSVSAVGMSALRYQWRRDGLELLGQTNASFSLTNVQSSHEGAYTVAISDRYTSVLSASATLVMLINPAIVEPPLSQTVVAGGDLTLSVRVTGHPPPFGYLWRRGSLPLTNFVLTSSNCFFTLTNVQPSQGGPGVIYRVIVTNAALPVVATNATFTLNVLPDNDGDRIPDAWEAQYSLNAASSADGVLDPDADGMSNIQEYVAGTDPRDPLSYLKVDRLELGPTRIEFHALSNRTYSVQFRDSLSAGDWTRLTDVIGRLTNRVEFVIDPVVRTQRHYRLVTPRQP